MSTKGLTIGFFIADAVLIALCAFFYLQMDRTAPVITLPDTEQTYTTGTNTHQLLDAVGDLYMCNHSILGEFRAYKTGHAVNNLLLRTLLADAEAWELVTFETERARSPIRYMDTQLALA